MTTLVYAGMAVVANAMAAAPNHPKRTLELQAMQELRVAAGARVRVLGQGLHPSDALPHVTLAIIQLDELAEDAPTGQRSQSRRASRRGSGAPSGASGSNERQVTTKRLELNIDTKPTHARRS